MTEQELEDFIDRFVIEELPENTVLVNSEKNYTTKEGRDSNET